MDGTARTQSTEGSHLTEPCLQPTHAACFVVAVGGAQSDAHVTPRLLPNHPSSTAPEDGGPSHSFALLAPMGPHLRSLRLNIYDGWPDSELALLAAALPGLVELDLDSCEG
jgi:hypothetical protein